MIEEYINSLKQIMKGKIIDNEVYIAIPEMINLLFNFSRIPLLDNNIKIKINLVIAYLFNPIDVIPDKGDFTDYLDDFYLLFYLYKYYLLGNKITNNIIKENEKVNSDIIKRGHIYFSKRVRKKVREEILSFSCINYVGYEALKTKKIVNSLLAMIFKSNKPESFKRSFLQLPEVQNFYEALGNEEKAKLAGKINSASDLNAEIDKLILEKIKNEEF